ncbi:hypothetical protein I5M07_06305 [Flavobacterium sp. SE-1-e]|uniref:NUMOD4 motif-containing protein n=2 Tax=Flavobacterium agrisoli TaxID=2793066 RepID=A0A934PJS0_9FLAO|nr:hypothetical protein [Flavobacterium agrisoli]
MMPIRVYPNEEFREITLEDKLKFRYAISNKGRLISFVNDIKIGRELKGAKTDGYKVFKYKIFKNGKITNKHLFFSKLIAEYFIPKTSEDQTYVLHLDRKRDNDDYRNLKWATREEMLAFWNKSPKVMNARKKLVEHNLNSDGRKLTVTKVMLIKKLLAKPEQKTRLKMIAKQFGVSEMQIRRIKSGENWSQIKI